MINFNDIEYALGFELKSWQKDYIEDRISYKKMIELTNSERQQGVTIAYVLKDILKKEEMNMDLLKLKTEHDYKSMEYKNYYRKLFISIRNKLIENDISVCKIYIKR